MTTKLFLMCVTAAGAACTCVAMPTEAEVEKAVANVERMLASEKVALESGKMTRAQVAEAAMKFAADANDEAAKLLLMKGAFILHVMDGDLEKAVRTMNALETVIADVPPNVVTNIIETALLGLPYKTDARRILFDSCCSGAGRSYSQSRVAVSQFGYGPFRFGDQLLSTDVPMQTNDTAIVTRYEPIYGSSEVKDEFGFAIAMRRYSKSGGGLYEIDLSPGAEAGSGKPEGFDAALEKFEAFKAKLKARLGVELPATQIVVKKDVYLDMIESKKRAEKEGKEKGRIFAYEWPVFSVPSFDYRGTQIALKSTAWTDCPTTIHMNMRRLGQTAQRKPTLRAKPRQVSDQQETIDGYTWSYSIRNGGASIEAPGGKYECAVSPTPEGSIVIPSKLGGVSVTRIGRAAFSRCHALTEVTIPPTVTSIGMSAFYECRMKSVAIPPAVKEIGELAFYNSSLKSVTIPEGVTSIGGGAFGDCWSLESVSIPSSVTSIGKNAVASGSNRMKSIVVSPDNPKYAVYGDLFCTKDGKTVLGSVGGEVKIPDGVTCIAERAFYKCYGLTSVVIPSSAVEIGDSAFEWCDDIYSFEVSPENRVFASPNGLLCTKDGKTVIAGVNGDVVIPEGVTRIGDSAFTGRKGLTSLTMPSSVRSLGSEVFRCCKGLESVTMRGEKPNAQKGLFDYCDKLKAIHVPVNAKSWSGMKNWFGIRLVFDGAEGDRQSVDVAKAGSEQREQLAAIQGELARVRGEKTAVKDSTPEVHKAIESILKGMIKVPGRDYWLSATEVTQEQWEPVMEYNLSQHKGPNLPVEMVSRDDCDVFLEKLNQTKEVRESQFEICLPTGDEWLYAALGGSGVTDVCWIKPGVAGNVLDMAWVKENSSNLTHEVATKASNAFGLYDMKGNVWEWLFDSEREMGVRRGHAFVEDAEKCSLHNWRNTPRNLRYGDCGLRLAAHKRVRPLLGGSLRARRLQRQQEAEAAAAKQREEQASNGAESQAQAEQEKRQREAERAEERQRLLAIQDELRRVHEAKAAAAGAKIVKESAKNRTSTQSIIDGMLKVPEKDYWLSETELTQGQWVSVMGNNPSEHKGANLPVECVSRNDCDVFLEKLNQTKEVRNSKFVFSLPTEGEWLCATRIKGDILDRAWVLENSSTQTHAVATKAANELGFYDMQGNVWEWLANDQVAKGCRRGGAFSEGKGGCSVHRWIHTPRGRRYNCCGLRLAAHVRPSQKLDKGDMEVCSPTNANGLYCVIDISGGSNAECYPVSYLNTEPRDGWTDEHKTNKIVLRRVDAGTWPTMDGRRVTFTKPFYIGIFELTQKQIKLVTGDEMRKFVFEGDMRPADCLTWEEMRGKNDEFDYPKTKEVASGCVIGRLRAKTGLGSIDLPTSYQYGCAWNAGTDGSGRDARLTGRHFHNQRDGKGAFNAQHTTVGSYQPNEWGIYDLHGNVWEMCLDRCGSGKDAEADPEGPVEGEKRQLRGGGWHSSDSFIFSNFIPQNKEANDTHGMTGCRIVINTLAEKANERRRQL